MSIGMAHLDGALQLKVGTIFGRELILITESKMEIQTWFLGFQIARRTFNMELVRQLRYEEWTERGVRAYGIRFKYDGTTHVLIRANESETLRTVVRIINVYKFSHTVPTGEASIA
jgi:hypothetical protein